MTIHINRRNIYLEETHNYTIKGYIYMSNLFLQYATSVIYKNLVPKIKVSPL